MKNHIATIILLLLAAVAFALRFFVKECLQTYCDILAFALPTVAAIVEIVLSEQSSNKLKEEIEKRAVWESLTEEELDKLRADGKLDENTYYATIENIDN